MKAVAAIMLMTAVACIAGCTKPDEPNNGGNDNGGNGDGGGISHEYVDLDLPSGTLWATCNVGATTPEEYGDYFAWGETEPKDIYNWHTYQLCNGNSDQFIKYCIEPQSNGFVDGLTILQPSDDAATVNWGVKWCMPSKEQWEELIHNTTIRWVTQNGVNGCLFASSNGKSIFLPASGGFWEENEISGIGRWGDYWLNSLDINSSVYAWKIYFDSDGCSVVSNRRRYGFTVRPVRSAQ